MTNRLAGFTLPESLEVKLLYGKYAVLLALGIGGVVYHLWFARTYGIEMDKHMIVHLGIMMVAVGVVQFDPKVLEGDFRDRIDNFLVLPVETLLAVGITGYLLANYARLAYMSIGVYSQADTVVGGLLVLLVLDLSRRSFGLVLPIVGIIGLVYAIYGPYFPGLLTHQGISFNRVLTATTVEFTGIFDTILRVSATYIVIFIIFAGFLESYGALAYFIKIGAKAGSYIKSGITQTAVISSLGMGSVNGSAAANSATTGAFTIPLLKSQGINENTAAAIESVASSGGQIMPPIMGAAAFIMAEITGTSYVHIITIGLLPALLFYGTIAVAVHLLTLKEGAELKKLSENISTGDAQFDEDDDGLSIQDIALGKTNESTDILEEATRSSGILESIVSGLYLWIPVGVLIYTLIVLQYDPLYAGFWATLSALPTALVQSLILTDDYGDAVKTFVGNTLDACRLGIENTAPIALAAAVMGLFVGVLSLTGFTQTLAQGLVELAGGSLVLLLFLAMFAAILFGMGMPTVAAYIVSVLLVAPALADMGMRLETAHFFVFYFAILSAITPPVAIACIITTEIADGQFWRVCQKSILLGMPLFLLPYVFVANDELLYWSFPNTLISALIIFVAMVALSTSLIRYMNGPLSRLTQGGLIVGSLGVIFVPVLPVVSSVSLTVRFGLAAALLGFLIWKNELITHIRSFAGST